MVKELKPPNESSESRSYGFGSGSFLVFRGDYSLKEDGVDGKEGYRYYCNLYLIKDRKPL